MHQLKRKDIVCFDSNVVIWSICSESGAELAETELAKIEKARHLLEECSRLQINVYVPSVALAEVISGCKDSQEATNLQRLLFKHFRIAPFDAFAANIYADLWRLKKEFKQNGIQIDGARKALKADCMIIATAIAVKAKCIYTGDGEVEKFKKFAQSRIAISGPPSFASQTAIL